MQSLIDLIPRGLDPVHPAAAPPHPLEPLRVDDAPAGGHPVQLAWADRLLRAHADAVHDPLSTMQHQPAFLWAHPAPLLVADRSWYLSASESQSLIDNLFRDHISARLLPHE